MRTLRASELGNFQYCQRVWWYQREGLPSDNQLEMSGGSDFHRSHSREVKLALVFKGLALLLLIVGISLIFDVSENIDEFI